MKVFIQKTFFFFLLILGVNLGFSQLNPGDIAFVQYNADGTDNFAFVCLVDIPSNAIIIFTDNEENSLSGGEGTITWTAPVAGVTCGTVITITTTPSATIGTVTEINNLDFSGSGDGIIAYQGSAASPTFIAALGNDGTTAGVYGGASEGNLPTGLTLGVNAQSIAEIDNAKYNGSVLNDTKANILSAIYNANNWLGGSNTTQQTFSNTFTVTDCVILPCAEPTTDAIFHVNSPISITTNSVTLNWTNGNGVKRIVVLSNVNPITFVPTDNTTYTSNTNFGTSTAVAANEYIVYDGSNNSVNITGLVPGTIYYTTIYEYRCNPGSEDYFISGTPTTDIFLTEPENPTSFTKNCIGNTSIDLSWAAPALGNFDGYLLVVRENANPHSVNSIDPSSIIGENLDYSIASTYGGTLPNTRYIYKGTNTNVTVTGLTLGTSYTFKIFTFVDNGSLFEYSNGTSTTQIIAQENIVNAIAIGDNGQVSVSWANPNNSCFDEILIVANQTNGINFTPSGDGSAYTANSNYTAVNQVVYQNNGTNITVTNLTNGTTYYFEIFVRNGTTWSSGIEVSATPNTQTIFNPGDILIVAYDNAVGTFNDAITILTLVDIQPNTTFWYANTSYEIGAPANIRTAQWRACSNNSNAEIGAQHFTYLGPSILPAGSTFCIDIGINQVMAADFTVNSSSGAGTYNFSNGLTPAGFTSNINISTSKPDSVFLMQGSWSGNLGNYRTFNGTILSGIQEGATWHAVTDDLSGVLSENQKRRSRIPPEIQCFAIQGGTSTGSSYAYYNGTKTGSHIGLLSNITNYTSNWTSNNGSNANEIAAQTCIASYVFNITGTATPGIWTNAKNDSNWFNCGNWENLSVPDETIDVIVNTLGGTDKVVVDDTALDADLYGNIAKCKNLTIHGEKVELVSDSNDILEIHGDITITNGELDMDDSNVNTDDGTLYLYGNWINSAESRFLQGNSTVKFVGTNSQTIHCNLGIETEQFYNLVLDNNFTTDDFNNDIIAQGNLELTTGKTLLIKANHYASITKNIQNDGQITIEHNGSLAQIENTNIDNNTGIGSYIVHKTTQPYIMYDYTYWAAPIKNATLATIFSANPSNHIYTFNPQNFSDEYAGNGYPQTTGTADAFDDTGNDWEHASGNMILGKGYAIMGEGAIFPFTTPTATTNTQNVVFNGKVNNGLITIPVFKDLYNTTNGFGNAFNKNDNFIGNPYPSAINANVFLATNPNLGGTLYFWTHDSTIGTGANIGPDTYNFTNDDYATWNTSGGTAAHLGNPTPTGKIASGQGFYVTATANETIRFNNDMRLAIDNNLFYRPQNRVWLNLTNNNGLFRQILIGFFENATNEEDRLYDGLRLENGTNFDFYSLVNGKKMAIQGLAPLTIDTTIPLGIEIIEAGNFKISIDHVEGDLENTTIYLKDKLLNNTHALKQLGYNFNTTTLGNINDRFELLFQRNTLSNTDINIENIKIIAINNATNLELRLNKPQIIKSISIYNIIGQLLLKDNPNTLNYTTTKIKSNTILLIKIRTENNKTIIKQFIKR